MGGGSTGGGSTGGGSTGGGSTGGGSENTSNDGRCSNGGAITSVNCTGAEAVLTDCSYSATTTAYQGYTITCTP